MAHLTHRLKCYTGDHNKKLVFCEMCGQEEDEAGIHEPCTEKFFKHEVQTIVDKYKGKSYGNFIAR